MVGTALTVLLVVEYLHLIKGEVFRIGYISGSDRQDKEVNYNRPGYQISGAISLAINQTNSVHPDYLLLNHSLEFEYAETFGKEDLSIKHAARFCQDPNINVIIGPQETCFHEARLASSFNKLMLTYYCDRTFKSESNKAQYSTFVTVKPPASQISKSVVSLLRHHNWRKVTLVYNNASENNQRTAESIQYQLKNHGVEVLNSVAWSGQYFVGLEAFDVYPNPFPTLVAETKNKTRIYVVIGDNDGHIGFLNAMHNAGLLESGDYFVVGVYTQPLLHSPASYLCGKFEDVVSNITRKAFRSFLGVIPRGFTVNFTEFNKHVNDWNERPPFNFGWDKEFPHKQVRFEAAYLHDSVFLYARALNECLANGSDCDPKDGSRLMQFLLDKPYSSAMGYMGYIDANGDAEGNYTLMYIKNNPKGFGKCTELPLDRATNFKSGLVEIGTFLLRANGSELPRLVFKRGLDIYWPSGQIPLDEPECGFDGAKCVVVQEDKRRLLVGVVITAIVVAVVGVAFAMFRYRQWVYERELDSLIWKINWVDLQVDELHEFLTTMSNIDYDHQSQLCLSAPSFDIAEDLRIDSINVSIGLGYYRKQLVAIKRLKKGHVNVTREVKIDMKMMRELRHDNLCSFIGACVDPVAIVMEYIKSNIRDLLYDERYAKLDSMFITAFIIGLIEGMQYIHNSPLKSHGRLKIANLLVDSRFTLKITDYGLNEFRRRTDANDIPLKKRSEDYHFDRLLWTAPELLRQSYPPLEGTQSGDVYSFGIVLYEIYGRSGPFGGLDMDARRIVELLRSTDMSQPLRPNMDILQGQGVPEYVINIITDCYAEDMTSRPNFQTIKRRFSPMTKGMSQNLTNNMVNLLLKYATNLEGLVDERTLQLREEKKKTETLLYEILPRPVAEHLIREEQVEAEQFDCVTIFFSDIVGFTALSAESTPFEVVAFLNNLYTLFDNLLAQYDAYKVETIGDSYMVCSGLPIRNGNAHAGVIASMALHLLDTIRSFRIAHRPDKKLLLRVGTHSGPVVAGVVGRKMPRYCLFGDTVNTASRYESTGEAQKIHCSPQCKAILDELGGYEVEPRGLVHMKGKGDQLTFWIVDEDESHKMHRKYQEYTSMSDLAQASPILAKWGSQNAATRTGRRFSTLRKQITPGASPQPSKASSNLRLDTISVRGDWAASVSGGADMMECRTFLHADLDTPLLRSFLVESQSGNSSPRSGSTRTVVDMRTLVH